MKCIICTINFAAVIFYAFSLLATDNSHALRSIAIGGEANYYRYLRDISVDKNGNIHLLGEFKYTLTLDDEIKITSEIGPDIFIAKLDSREKVIWAKVLQGTAFWQDRGKAIATDTSGNIYIISEFSAIIDMGSGITIASNGQEDILIAKLDSKGDLIWAKAIGGTDADRGNDIAVDSTGNVYVTGLFRENVDFGDGVNHTSIGDHDAYICKLDQNGQLVWVKTIGGENGTVEGSGISVDNNGNAYTTGCLNGIAAFGDEITLANSGDNTDIFVSKVDSAGNLLWARSVGGESFDCSKAISVGNSGYIYIAGYFKETAYFGAEITLGSNGHDDIFVSKVDSAGNFIWATSMGGAYEDRAEAISVNNNGDIYITGHFRGIAYWGDEIILSSDGDSRDIFVSKVDSFGNFLWAKSMGGDKYDIAQAISVDNNDHIYIAWHMETSDANHRLILSKYGPYVFSWPVVLPAVLNKKD